MAVGGGGERLAGVRPLLPALGGNRHCTSVEYAATLVGFGGGFGLFVAFTRNLTTLSSSAPYPPIQKPVLPVFTSGAIPLTEHPVLPAAQQHLIGLPAPVDLRCYWAFVSRGTTGHEDLNIYACLSVWSQGDRMSSCSRSFDYHRLTMWTRTSAAPLATMTASGYPRGYTQREQP